MAKRIDITPTWSDMLPVMLSLAENGRMHDEVRKEFYRMAELADMTVQDAQERKTREAESCKREPYFAPIFAVAVITEESVDNVRGRILSDVIDRGVALCRDTNDVIAVQLITPGNHVIEMTPGMLGA